MGLIVGFFKRAQRGFFWESIRNFGGQGFGGVGFFLESISNFGKTGVFGKV